MGVPVASRARSAMRSKRGSGGVSRICNRYSDASRACSSGATGAGSHRVARRNTAARSLVRTCAVEQGNTSQSDTVETTPVGRARRVAASTACAPARTGDCDASSASTTTTASDRSSNGCERSTARPSAAAAVRSDDSSTGSSTAITIRGASCSSAGVAVAENPSARARPDPRADTASVAPSAAALTRRPSNDEARCWARARRSSTPSSSRLGS